MGNKRDLDDWGTLPTRKEVESTTVVKKWVLSVLCLAIFVSLGFWYLKPTQEIKQEVKQDSKDYNDLTSKTNNYGYPDNVVIPKNVEKVLSSVEGDVNQEGSEIVKSYLEDIRSSVVETEKEWDVTKLGSRKYIDYKLPSNLEMVLLEDNSVLKLVLRHTLEMGLKDKLNDGFYLIINPLDEAQMYLKKEFYTRAEEDTTTNYLVYINDVVNNFREKEEKRRDSSLRDKRVFSFSPSTNSPLAMISFRKRSPILLILDFFSGTAFSKALSIARELISIKYKMKKAVTIVVTTSTVVFSKDEV